MDSGSSFHFNRSATMAQWVRRKKDFVLICGVLLLSTGASAYMANMASASPAVNNTACGRLAAPLRLRVNNVPHPLGIDSAKPEFSWILHSTTSDEKQSSYQITLADSHAHLIHQTQLLWNSGQVVSSLQNGVRYAGEVLKPMSRYWWRVRVWGRDGQPSGWSNSAEFETGILNAPNNWKGNWVGGRFNLIRGQFTLPRGKHILHARAYVAGRQFHNAFFDFYVNGVRPTRDVLLFDGDFPGQTNYYTFNITKILRAGKANAFGAMYGAPGAGRNNILLCDIKVWFTDGSTLHIGATNAQCRGLNGGPVIAATEYGGEDYDAQKQIPAWDKPRFNASAWAPVTVYAQRPKAALAVLNNCKIQKRFYATSMTEPAPGVYIYNVGNNISGWARLKVKGPAGTRIRLRFAEHIYKNGLLDRRSLTLGGLGASQTDTYTLKGGAEEQWQPYLTYHGFHYVELTGFPGRPTLHTLKMIWEFADVTRHRAHFACSNSLLNRINRAFFTCEADNMQFTQTACDQRGEREPWGADAFCVASASMIYFDAANFWREKWINISNKFVGPEGQAGALLLSEDNSITWDSHCLFIPWDYWQAYGDRSYLPACYRRAKLYANCCINLWSKLGGTVVFNTRIQRFTHYTNEHDYLMHANAPWVDQFGKPLTDMLNLWNDWESPLGYGHPNRSFIASAYYYRICMLTSRMAIALGHQKAAAYYAGIGHKIKAAINARYLHRGQYYCGDEQAANAIALVFGIVRPVERGAVLESLIANIKKRNQHLSTGCLGTLELMSALENTQGQTAAFALATQRTYPSWGYMLLSRHATGTFWEQWKYVPDESFNHMFLAGSVAAWLYQAVGGIKMLQPGYATIQYQPGVFGNLTWARASVSTIRGRASIKWQRTDNGLQLRIGVPVNARGVVKIPLLGHSGTSVTVYHGHTRIFQQGRFFPETGIRSAAIVGRYAVLHVGSGRYVFVVAY